MPEHQHFLPNQHHFFGPINQHQEEEQNQVNLDLNLVNVPIQVAPGMDQWGPQENFDLNVYLKLHSGKILELQEPMEPPPPEFPQPHLDLPIMDDNSDITLSVGSNDSEETIDGFPMQIDLNAHVLALAVPDQVMQQPHQPVVAHEANM